MKLFWKLFLALLLSLLGIAAASSWFSQRWMLQTQQTEQRLNQLAGYADTAANLYAEEGPDALRRWLQRNMQQQHFRGFLLDSQGMNVIGRRVPQALSAQIDTTMRTNTAIKQVRPPHMFAIVPVSTVRGQYYWVASSLIAPDAMQDNRQATLIFQLLLALSLVLLVSWMLSRIFTRPIRQLQLSASQLGSGRMDTRTPQALAARGDELGEMARSFDAMALQLQTLMSSHKQLLRDVSHELRSPLARLTVALELARDMAGEAAQEDLSRIGREAERLNELIGEVLSLARFEQGAIQADMQELDFSALLEEVIADASFEAEAAGKRVESDIIEGCRMRGDRLWLQRALDNVLRNAVRHTANGTAVEIGMRETDKGMETCVRDHGSGVPDKALERIFEPFFRAEEARTRSGGGYGLGLAIARSVLELHGGHIRAAHAPGGGLQIQITLPCLTQ